MKQGTIEVATVTGPTRVVRFLELSNAGRDASDPGPRAKAYWRWGCFDDKQREIRSEQRRDARREEKRREHLELDAQIEGLARRIRRNAEVRSEGSVRDRRGFAKVASWAALAFGIAN